MSMEGVYKLIVFFFIIILLIVICIRGVFFAYLIALCRFFYLNREKILYMHESNNELESENRNQICELENRVLEFEDIFQKLEKKNKKYGKRIKNLEKRHGAFIDEYCNNHESPVCCENVEYEQLSHNEGMLNQPQSSNMPVKQLPAVSSTFDDIKKVGLKKGKTSSFADNKMFEASQDGKLVVKKRTYDKIYVEPEDLKVVEKTFQLYGLDLCFKVNREVRAGFQYRIVRVKKQCELQRTEGNCFRVLNQGELEIAEIMN